MAMNPEQTGHWKLQVTVSHWARAGHDTHSDLWSSRTGTSAQLGWGRRPLWGQEPASRALGGGSGDSQPWGSGPGAACGESPAQHSPCRPPLTLGGSSVTLGLHLTSLGSHFLLVSWEHRYGLPAVRVT